MQVSAATAGAWVPVSPEHDQQWPQCEGRCTMGVCALKWDHPACCHVGPTADNDSDDSESEWSASPYTAAQEGQDASASSEGY
jgi:hypothetical protein